MSESPQSEAEFGETVPGLREGQFVFGRYSLEDLLGRGGMGVVWRCRDSKLERDVALKFLPELVRLDEVALKDLKQETNKSLELTHPNIVRIHDLVSNEEMAAIAMEYVTGSTLRKLNANHFDETGTAFSAGEIDRWTRQLCEALEYAHSSARIVHRDLKPANLMVSEESNLKVADFGVACSLHETHSRLTRERTTSGTLAYMSPQQMMGEHPSASDDIYALGSTLYELLTGKPPFFRGEIFIQVREKEPTPINEQRALFELKGEPVPEEWESTIGRCLAKEPSGRPQSAREVAQCLGLLPDGPDFARTPARGLFADSEGDTQTQTFDDETVIVQVPPTEKEVKEKQEEKRRPTRTRWLMALMFTCLLLAALCVAYLVPPSALALPEYAKEAYGTIHHELRQIIPYPGEAERKGGCYQPGSRLAHERGWTDE